MILSGCGSKGNLYQIEEPEAAQKVTVKERQQNTEEPKKKQP